MIKNVSEILDAIPLEQVIGDYVSLQRRGVNLVGNCPFHDEKSGSFTVSPTKGIYKCFGCGKSGHSAAKFLMDYKDITFPEAMQKLAYQSNTRIEYLEGINAEEYNAKWKADSEERTVLKDTMTQVIELMKAHTIQPSIDYGGKVYNQETIDKWGLFYFDKNVLAQSKIPVKDLISLGLIKQNDSGRYYDSFIKRLIFPIRHSSGNVEAWVGRSTQDKQQPKYLNSSDSLLYSKTNSLFGIYEAAKAIHEREFAYLVEGPTDVLKLDEHGISNVVASLGTALTVEQVKRLGRYTDRVIILRDPDKAGVLAATRDVEIITKCQLQASVVFLPDGKDPAEFISEKGADDFKEYIDGNTQDGIIWRIKKELGGKKDPFAKNITTDLAAKLIALLESEGMREMYAKDAAAIIGITIKVMSDAIKGESDKKLVKSKKLSPEQEINKAKYGVYAENSRFYYYTGQCLSNFIIKPIFLARSGDKSYRVFEMVNEDNFSLCLSLNSDDLIALNQFRKKTEMHGNYVFEGGDKEFLKVRKMIYSDMQKVYQLAHLGYIPQSRVYAWGNGVTTPTGEFIPVDDYGHVQYEKYHYYLPAFSKILTQEIVQYEDDSDYEKLFIYKNAEIDFKSWYEDYTDLFGDNSIISVAFYVASVFKDYAQKRFNSFPILNLFGPAQSGKSTMGNILNCMFGQPINAVHCITATWSSFFRRPAQCANAIALYEEYSEKVDKERQEGLKSFYDGFGRPLAKKETSNKTESMPVLSSIVLLGQVLPTHDPALLSRCITVFFKEVYASKEKKQKLDRMIKRGKRGEFSAVTAQLHSKREEIIAKFEEIFEGNKQFILQLFDKGKEPSTRVLMNYAVVVTFLQSALEVFKIKYKNAAIFDDLANRIKDQNMVNEGATELLEFWSIISFLIDTRKLNPDFFAVEYHTEIKVENIDTRAVRSEKWDKTKKLLFLKVNHAHKEYLMSARAQGLVRTLDANSIKYYLKINRSFLGEIKAKRHQGSTSRFWVFDLDAIPSIDINITSTDTADPYNKDPHKADFQPQPTISDHDLFSTIKGKPDDAFN